MTYELAEQNSMLHQLDGDEAQALERLTHDHADAERTAGAGQLHVAEAVVAIVVEALPVTLQSVSEDLNITPLAKTTRKPRSNASRNQRILDQARGFDTVKQYLKEIGETPLLTHDEEIALSKLVRSGNEAKILTKDREPTRAEAASIEQGADAKEHFIRANLRLVVSIAKRYPSTSLDLMDLIQEGNLGLEHAVDKFDGDRGFKFSTYATFWIKQAIGRALDQKDALIRVPADRHASMRAALRHVHGDAEMLSDDAATIHRLSTPVSLDKTVSDKGDVTLGDLMATEHPGPEDVVLASVDSEELERLLSILNDRERNAIELRFGLIDGERATLKEIGEVFGISSEAARVMINKALLKIRKDVESRMRA